MRHQQARHACALLLESGATRAHEYGREVHRIDGRVLAHEIFGAVGHQAARQPDVSGGCPGIGADRERVLLAAPERDEARLPFAARNVSNLKRFRRLVVTGGRRHVQY